MRDGPTPKHPLRIVVGYAAFGAVWLLLTDWAVAALAPAPRALASAFKGWIFVGATALLLYFFVRRQFRAATSAEAARTAAENARTLAEGQQTLAREAASAASARLAVATRAAGLGTWELETATGRLLCDAQMHTLYRIAPGTRAGTLAAWHESLHPEDRAANEQLTRATLEQGDEYHTQFRVLWPDGQCRHLESHAIVVRDAHGRATRLVGVNWDVTERVLAERRLRLLAEHVGDVFWTVEAHTLVLTYISPSVQKLRGYTPAELIGHKLGPSLTPDALALINEVLPRRLAAFLAGDPSARTQYHELEQYRRDGSTVWVETVSTFVRTDNGGIELLGVSRDITRRRAAEQALGASVARLAHAEQIAGIGHWSLDLQTREFEGSTNAALIYGLPQGGRWPIEQVQAIALPEYHAPLHELMRGLLSGTHPYDVVFKIRNAATGAIRSIHSRAEYDAAHQTVFGTIQDITEREQTLAELRTATARLTNAETIAGIGHWTMDYATGRAHGSAGARRIFGIQDDLPTLDRLLEHILPKYRQSVHEAHRALAAEHRPFALVYEIRRPCDGAVTTIRITAEYDAATNTSFGVLQDITEREKTLAALRTATAHLNSAELVAGIGHWSMDYATGIAEGSAGAVRLFGLTTNRLTLEQVESFILPEYHETLHAAQHALVTAGRPFDVTYEIRRPDTGALVTLRSLVQYDPATQTGFGVLQDITERRRAEAQLRLQSAALNAAAHAIVITDAAGNIEWINPAFTALSGYSAEDAIAHNLGQLVHSGAQPPAFYHELWATILAGETWHGELVNRHKDGSLVPEEQTITPVRAADGTIAHFIAIKQDITARRRLQEQVLRSQRLESVGRLAGGIAHDLNNILAPVLMAPSVLRESVTDPANREILDAVEISANRGAAIIRQLLTFSRGGATDERTPVQLRHIVGEMVAIIRETFPKNIVTRTALHSDPWLVEADATQLHQVLMNLCVNSCDAMPDGGTLTIALENVELDPAAIAGHPGAAPGPHVLLGVFDTGGGIAPEHLDKVFDPFFTTKAVGKGTGLGLATVLGIAHSHRGFVDVRSQPGAGTQVRVYLPAALSATAAAEPAETALPPRGHDELILVVDDEENVLRFTRRILEHHGYRVLTAADGAEALACYRQHRAAIRLVLTDLLMPNMDGAALIHAIRQLEPAARIIAVSGHANPEDPFPAGPEAVALLPKPYLRPVLLKSIATALGQP